MTSPSPRISHEDLVAYLDDELSGPPRQRVERALAEDPELAAQAELLRQGGDLVAGLPRIKAPAGFADRVVERLAREAEPEPESGRPGGSVLKLPTRWIAAAAAVLVGAVAWWGLSPGSKPEALTAFDEEAIARDLYVLTNLDMLEALGADEIGNMVDDLDLLEAVEADPRLVEEG